MIVGMKEGSTLSNACRRMLTFNEGIWMITVLKENYDFIKRNNEELQYLKCFITLN